jgi:precorrin-6A/cobalt-precorrin-6A reductase
MDLYRILILGGTSEARQLAGRLAAREKDLEVTLSLAGRTVRAAPQPVPVRTGGFGGAAGLAAYLAGERIDLLIDATHPYAARISENAAAAAAASGVPILALRRPAWRQASGDRWIGVASVADAVRALGQAPRRVFLALGRNEVAVFEAAPQHRYIVRSVDPVEPKLALPGAIYLVARGPFPEAGERELLEAHGIDTIVCKNSGGSATRGKIAAARDLGIEVVMIERPKLPDVPAATDVDELVRMIDHLIEPVEKRGV